MKDCSLIAEIKHKSKSNKISKDNYLSQVDNSAFTVFYGRNKLFDHLSMQHFYNLKKILHYKCNLLQPKQRIIIMNVPKGNV